MGSSKRTLTKIDRPFMVCEPKVAGDDSPTLYVALPDGRVDKYELTRAATFTGAKRGLYAYRGRYGEGYANVVRDAAHKPHPKYTIEYYTRRI